MKTSYLWILSFLALVTPSPAAAAPTLPFADLRQDVARARAADPRAFARVSDLVALAPDANARARARRAPIALYVASLGPSAVLPTLELLALDPPRGVPSESAPALRRELIEATGLLRDARAVPVLAAILEDPKEEPETTRTTTEALARIGGATAASKILTTLASARDARARAILAGMGELRRVDVAEELAARLRAAPDDATARVAARSLGRAGNAWAWRAESDRTDESRIRATAARALVEAFMRWSGEARTAAESALLVVDAPETPALIAEARRSATPELARALDGLAAHYARSPLHR